MGNQKNDNQIKADSGNPDDPNDFDHYEPLASHLPFDNVNQL